MDEILGRTQGWAGWSPVPAIADRGDDKVMVIADFVGGEDNKPTSEIGKYVGVDGLVADIEDAVALPKGATGEKPKMNSTSITSNVIATGAKTFILVTPIDLVLGQVAKAYSLADPTNYVCGYIFSITPTEIVITVSEIGGTGTKTDWVIVSSAFRGPIGISTTNMTTANRILGLNAGDSVPQPPKELSVVGASIVANVFTINYQNAVSAYNAASGVDTQLNNTMSPLQMFQNLQKQNDNRYNKADGDSRYLPKYLGGATNGTLIKTDINSEADALITLHLIGNGYTANLPINTILQCYNSNGSNAFLAVKSISLGYNFNITVFKYESVVQFWIEPLSSSTILNATVLSGATSYNRVTSITNVVKPTTGVTRELAVTPVKTLLNNGLATNVLLGDGTYGEAPLYYINTLNNVINLNSTNVRGYYYQPNSADATLALNYPVAEDGILLVYGSSTRFLQKYTTIETGDTYIRQFASGSVWKAWKKQLNSGGSSSNLYLGDGTTKPLSDFIPATQKGAANGVVPLNASSQIDQTYLPSYVDDIIEGYKSGANFYKEVGLTTLITGETGKIYVDLTTGQNSKQYRWSGSAYIQITNGLIASTNDVSEGGSNLYFTVARVLATVISGFSAAAGIVANTDTILQAINKIVGNIAALQTALDLKANIAAATGTLVALTFTSDSVQGTIASPLTGNITGNITGAKLGVVTLVIHNHTTAPTFDSKYKKLSGSGSYVTGSINYIFCEYINDTEIIYSINQRT